MGPSPRRLRLLVGALAACVAALPLSWWLRGARAPAPPPAGASSEIWRAYWQQRIKADVSDREAYLRLGQLEERTVYYNAAVRHLTAARALGASDKEVCGPLGRAFTHLSRDNEALPELEKAVRLAPQSVDAVTNLAGLYINQEQPEAAARLLSRFARANPDISPEDGRRLAFALLECGATADAREIAERLTAADQDDIVARGVAMRGAIAARDFKVARKHLEVILRATPNEPSTLYLYGNTLNALGDREGALLQWKKVVSLNPRAVDAFERIGDTYAVRKDFAHAAVAYETLARQVPTGRTTTLAAEALARSGQTARSAYWRALAAGFAGNFTESLRLGQIAASAPDPATRRLGLQAVAEAYRGMRKREPYLATMQKLTSGGSVDDLLIMARAWEQADRHEERTQWLERAARIAPPERRPDILHGLSTAYMARGMRDPAEKALKDAAALAPKDVSILKDLANLYLDRRNEGGRLEEAVRLHETIVAANPTEADAWRWLGVAYSAAGQPVKAVQSLEHAIDLEPGDGPSYLELSKAYIALGDTESGRRSRELYATYVGHEQRRLTLRTRAWRPNATAADVKAYADLLVQSGADEDAARWYEKALTLAPKNAEVRRQLIAVYSRLRRIDRVQELRAATP